MMRRLKIAVIMDPIEKVEVDKDTTFVLMLEAQHRGHKVYYAGLEDLSIRGAVPQGVFHPIELNRGAPHYRLGAPASNPLTWYDVILMRKDPPFDIKYLFATYVLGLVDERRCLVINHPQGIREANEKLYALNFPELIPETLVSGDMGQLKQFMEEQGGEMIIKPLDGCGGSGVFYVNRKDKNTNSILELATSNGRNLIMAQRYLPEIRQGDKRIIVLNGEPLGAVLRIPRRDETRANIHVGGQAVKTDLTSRDREICRVLSPHLRKSGLFFVGLDVIGGYLTEINVTSPTGVQEVNSLDRVRLESEVLDFIEKKAARKNGDDHTSH